MKQRFIFSALNKIFYIAARADGYDHQVAVRFVDFYRALALLSTVKRMVFFFFFFFFCLSVSRCGL